MKKISLIVTLFYSVSYAQVSKKHFEINDIAFFECIANTRINQAGQATSASNNFDIKYYRCEWETDPAVRYIKGNITSYFVITENSDYISFDLMDSLRVDSVKQRNNALSFSHINNTLKI